MRLTIIRRTVRDGGKTMIVFSIGTDFCIWSGMDGFGRYLWKEFDLPDKDGIHVFNIVDPANLVEKR